ncbi:hypothetical protein [Streptomyces sp. NPDC060035]|uniref:hypothetical protein n=1 Tax=Streptomyces sp. NPDC060035 TaxID=3347044 RepID=UPI0036852E75
MGAGDWQNNVSVHRAVWAKPGGSIFTLAAPPIGSSIPSTQHIPIGAVVIESGVAVFEHYTFGADVLQSKKVEIPLFRVPNDVELLQGVGGCWPSDIRYDDLPSGDIAQWTVAESYVGWSNPDRILHFSAELHIQGTSCTMRRLGYQVTAFFRGRNESGTITDVRLREFLDE